MRASTPIPVACALLALAAGCGEPPDPADAGGDAPGALDADARCTLDPDCDDTLFCNGLEACVAGACAAATPPCPATACDETADRCATTCADSDGDGTDDVACGGTDCDDADPDRFPGNLEVCDAADLDEDCDGRTFGFRDADGDGSPDALCCNADGAGRRCGDDCDDARRSVHGTATETCDGIDNDCDGELDEAVRLTWHPDADGDGYGDGLVSVEACAPPASHVLDASDCDDGDPRVHPGAFDVCDGTVDHDCNGTPDDPAGGCTCTNGDERPCANQMGRCAGAMQRCSAGTWESCDIVPTAETCDGSDENCDGVIDDGLPVATYHRDADADGFGDPAVPMSACRPVAGFVLDDRDCFDANADARPGQTMWFDVPREAGTTSFDYDCDGNDELEHAGLAACSRVGGCALRTMGWDRRTPDCGATGRWVTACALTGPTTCEPSMTTSRVARCH